MPNRRGTVGRSRVVPGRNWRLQPYVPPRPAAGVDYDPALDAARRAAGRGLVNLQQDTELGLARAGQDYGFGVEDLRRGQTRGNEDILRSGRREGEDYTRNTALLGRSFNILAGRQQEGANQAGVLRGGALLQAAAKRKENQGIQQRGLDIQHGRARQDLGTQWHRLGEDTATGIGRLGVGYNRQVTDFTTAQTRAAGEDTQFGLDTQQQQLFQATQNGWNPPPPPRRPRGRR